MSDCFSGFSHYKYVSLSLSLLLTFQAQTMSQSTDLVSPSATPNSIVSSIHEEDSDFEIRGPPKTVKAQIFQETYQNFWRNIQHQTNEGLLLMSEIRLFLILFHKKIWRTQNRLVCLFTLFLRHLCVRIASKIFSFFFKYSNFLKVAIFLGNDVLRRAKMNGNEKWSLDHSHKNRSSAQSSLMEIRLKMLQKLMYQSRPRVSYMGYMLQVMAFSSVLDNHGFYILVV